MAALPNPIRASESGGSEPQPFAQRGRPSADRAARTFKPRGRMTPSLRTSLANSAPVLLIPPAVEFLDHRREFGRTAPIVVDLGFGMGDSTIALAQQHHDWNVLGIDVHLPGIARVAEKAIGSGLTNIRLIAADAIDVLRYMVAPDSLAVVQIAFPDPWPKPSQRHRRLVDDGFVALLASRLGPAGELRLATDIDDYAEQMLAALQASTMLRNRYVRYAARDADRPVTKFERRALAAGRTIHDLAFVRN